MEHKWESSRDSIDIERCWMSPDEHSLSQRTEALIVDRICRTVVNLCVSVCVCICVRACERTLGGDSRYLGPTDVHLALQQPSNSHPCGMLRNVTSWRRLHCAWAVRQCKFPPVHTLLCFQDFLSSGIAHAHQVQIDLNTLISSEARNSVKVLRTDQNSIHLIQGLNQFEALIWEIWSFLFVQLFVSYLNYK